MTWISIEDEDPPIDTKLLVVKHYLDQKFSEKRGYYGKSFKTESFIAIDQCRGNNSWNGGYVTHFMLIPELPDGINKDD